MISGIKISKLSWLLAISVITLLAVNSRSFSSEFKNSADNIYDFCSDKNNLKRGKENCYAEEFQKIAERKGLDFSFKALESLQVIDPGAKGCHLISHGIGFGSYKKSPNDWRSLIQNMPTICNYGGAHGVLEGYIGSLSNGSLTKEVIPTMCGENPRADCNHIIGHLLLVETYGDIPKALELCNVFIDPTQKDFCLTGVFMEQETALNLVEHGLAPESWLNWPERLEELEKLCRSFDGEHASACWKEIVHVALVKFNNDPKKTWDFCNTAQSSSGADRCVRHSIGIIAASRQFNLVDLKSICSVPQKSGRVFQEQCYADLVSSTLSTIPTMVPESVSFCLSLERRFQQSCFHMIGSVASVIPEVKKLTIVECGKLNPELQTYCLRPPNQDSLILNPND